MRWPVCLSLPSLGLIVAVPAMAAEEEDGFKLSGSVRLRYEAIDGQARAGFNSSDTLTNIRTQILGEYRTGEVRFGVELFDSRAYGADAGTPLSTNEVNALEPVQAYVAADFKDALGRGTKLSMSAGRRTLDLDSRRMVAGLSVSTRTRSASCAASSISCVTSTTVRGCSRSISASSRRIFRRVR